MLKNKINTKNLKPPRWFHEFLSFLYEWQQTDLLSPFTDAAVQAQKNKQTQSNLDSRLQSPAQNTTLGFTKFFFSKIHSTFICTIQVYVLLHVCYTPRTLKHSSFLWRLKKWEGPKWRRYLLSCNLGAGLVALTFEVYVGELCDC